MTMTTMAAPMTYISVVGKLTAGVGAAVTTGVGVTTGGDVIIGVGVTTEGAVGAGVGVTTAADGAAVETTNDVSASDP